MTFAGQLRWDLRIERPAASAAGVRRAETFETVPGLERIAAKIRAVRGDEVARAGSLEGEVKFIILVRWQAAFNEFSTAWRAVNRRKVSEVYDLKFLDPMSGHNHMVALYAELRGL